MPAASDWDAWKWWTVKRVLWGGNNENVCALHSTVQCLRTHTRVSRPPSPRGGPPRRLPAARVAAAEEGQPARPHQGHQRVDAEVEK